MKAKKILRAIMAALAIMPLSGCFITLPRGYEMPGVSAIRAGIRDISHKKEVQKEAPADAVVAPVPAKEAPADVAPLPAKEDNK